VTCLIILWLHGKHFLVPSASVQPVTMYSYTNNSKSIVHTEKFVWLLCYMSCIFTAREFQSNQKRNQKAFLLYFFYFLWRCQAQCAWQRPPTTRPTTFYVWKTRCCQCSSRLLVMGGVSPETYRDSYKYGIIKFDTLLHFVGFFFRKLISLFIPHFVFHNTKYSWMQAFPGRKIHIKHVGKALRIWVVTCSLSLHDKCWHAHLCIILSVLSSTSVFLFYFSHSSSCISPVFLTSDPKILTL
jgi:hypothetical protein